MKLNEILTVKNSFLKENSLENVHYLDNPFQRSPEERVEILNKTEFMKIKEFNWKNISNNFFFLKREQNLKKNEGYSLLSSGKLSDLFKLNKGFEFIDCYNFEELGYIGKK